MSLPELDLQILYGRVAWAIVLAALFSALWARARPLPRMVQGLIAAGAAALVVLPGEGSAAFWLGLAFQWPSALLAGLCLARLYFAWQGEPGRQVMSVPLAAAIAIAGTALYLDAIGLLTLGMFYAGFGPRGAPALALLVAVLCSVAIVRNMARAQAAAVLGAVLMFSVPRLPTGNLWDALLDPLLLVWALVVLASACRERMANASRARAAAAA